MSVCTVFYCLAFAINVVLGQQSACWGWTKTENMSLPGPEIRAEVIPLTDCCIRCNGMVPNCTTIVYTFNGTCIYKASSQGARTPESGTMILSKSSPVPPGPSPGPAPQPSGPFPSGDGSVTPNFFANSAAWMTTDHKRLQVHSGMVFQDKQALKRWHWIGNSDDGSSFEMTSQNSQISLCSAPELYGPWGPEEILLTLPQARAFLGMDTSLTILERPKVYQDAAFYYLFVHVDNDAYRLRRTAVFKMSQLQCNSTSNPWKLLFFGQPGVNPNRKSKEVGTRGFEVLDFDIFFDPVTQELLYAATSDSYIFPPPNYCDTDVDDCSGLHCQACYNTAIMIWAIDVHAMASETMNASSYSPRAVLPGRWEGMVLFRKPGDTKTLYMLASGQDGFGPNPVSLFGGVLGVEAAPPSNQPTPSSYNWPAKRIFTCLGQPFSGSATALNSQPLDILENPYSPAHAIYIGDNWLHGPGKDYSSPGPCSDPTKGQPSGEQECEPWQGTCPCGWPGNNCPLTSSPGAHAGYIWSSFMWDQLGKTDYLICAEATWSLKNPPMGSGPCYTFNIFPNSLHTPGYTAIPDYEGKPTPFVMNSCGFAACQGWPMTPDDNTASAACCGKLGDSLTNAKFGHQCWRDTLCQGICKDYDFGNIPGGNGGCVFKPFDPTKAKLLGSSGKDCVMTRNGVEVLDQCRGGFSIPSSMSLWNLTELTV